MTFGDVLLIANNAAPYTAYGIGGGHDKLWNTNGTSNPSAQIDERNPDDMSVIQYFPENPAMMDGIGGTPNVIWYRYNTYTNRYITERAISDFSVIRTSSVASLGTVRGIDGDEKVIWIANATGNLIHELSPADFSAIRSGYFGTNGGASDPGGNQHVIWDHIDGGVANTKVRELAVSDFSELRRATCSGSENAYGCGGDETYIYVMVSWNNAIHKVDTGIRPYYVKPTGDDANDGLSWATAWKTIDHAARNLPDDGLLNIALGNYTEEPSGNTQSPTMTTAGTNIRYRPIDEAGVLETGTAKVELNPA